MTTDIALIGPHALALRESRMLALEQFGVSPHALVFNEETSRKLAKTSKNRRELVLQGEHHLVVV